MKKLVCLIICLFSLLFIMPLSVLAEENNNDFSDVEDNEIVDEGTIIKFNYYPNGSLSKEKELTFEWISTAKMENLLIKVFNPNLNQYVLVFDMSWDLLSEENTFDVEFEIINEPVDDPLTPDVDETINKLWEYKLTFVLAKDSYGLLKFKFSYTCGEKEYDNLFYLPNVVYPSVIVPPTNDKDENDNDKKQDQEGYFTTSNALIAAIFATICSVIGTLLIIFSSQYKKSDDEVLK